MIVVGAALAIAIPLALEEEKPVSPVAPWVFASKAGCFRCGE
jgi:hypothetical protein